MSTKELEQNQKLILEKLETLVSDRDKIATKEDIDKLGAKLDRLEAKLESKIDGVSSQVKELNDKAFS